MNTALVTGAGGLLGTWLVPALLTRGTEVVVLQRHGSAGVVADGVTLVTGDITDPAALDAALAARGVDTVFHLAAQSITGQAVADPAGTYETNVRGTWLVLDACRKHGVARALVASSDRVYGVAPGRGPLTEEAPLDARLPYDVSKAAADLIARSAGATGGGLAVAALRTTNLYGGGDRNRSRLVPELAAAIIEGRPPVIHTDGSPARRHLHAGDAANAYLAVADVLAAAPDTASGQAFNVAGDILYTVREVAETALALAGAGAAPAPDFRGAPVPPEEVDVLDIDSAKLRELTGWAPTVTLDEGLRQTVSWYRRQAETPARS